MNNQRDPNASPDAAIPTHIHVLLDRSGSMEAIRPDVIGGFNAFLASQQADGDDARLSLVQFDTADVADVVVDDAPIGLVPPLTTATFIPRGGTPLLDATGHLIARARQRAAARAAMGQPEAVIVVTITDGHENSSREYTRGQVRKLVESCQAEGWTFVFLSAGIDAYDEAHDVGYAAGSVQAWAPDAAGTRAAFSSLSDSMVMRRRAMRTGLPVDNSDFFGSDKPAEVDRKHYRGGHR
jgi:hypothetical protein